MFSVFLHTVVITVYLFVGAAVLYVGVITLIVEMTCIKLIEPYVSLPISSHFVGYWMTDIYVFFAISCM